MVKANWTRDCCQIIEGQTDKGLGTLNTDVNQPIKQLENVFSIHLPESDFSSCGIFHYKITLLKLAGLQLHVTSRS
jgi:hypothetical protein